MVHITYIESQPESNPTIAGRSKKYFGIGRVLIAYGVKLSINHNCGGTVTFEAKIRKHTDRGEGECKRPLVKPLETLYIPATSFSVLHNFLRRGLGGTTKFM